MEIVVGGSEKLYSKNLRDLLRIKEEDHQRNLNQSAASSSGGSRRSSSGLTLSAILDENIGQLPPADEPRRSVESNRTLLDIIRDDQTTSLGRGDSRRSWQHLTDKIRLRRRGGGSASPVPVPSSSSDVINNNRFNSNTESRAPVPPRNPTRSTESRRLEPMITGNGQRRSDAVEMESDGGGSPEQPVRMSLMSLLAENDRQMGIETSAYAMDEVEGKEGVEKETSTSSATGGGAEFNNCCVCMVRHKGAAFIPCGHTFCRLCCRELWVQRGNCPLCNNFILEILDIF